MLLLQAKVIEQLEAAVSKWTALKPCLSYDENALSNSA